METNNKERKMSFLLFIIIELLASAILGWVVSQLLLGRSETYRISWLWKYTILFYFLTGITIWPYFYKNYLPIFLSTIKFTGENFLISFPYFIILVFTKAVPIISVLTILPAQVIFLAGGFIWLVSMEIDPEVEKKSTNIVIKYLPILVLVIALSIFFGMPDIIILFAASLVMLYQSLSMLKQANENTLKFSTERSVNKADNNEL